MSVWYHYDVQAIAIDEKAVAKFFGIPVKDNVWTDRFEFSFGGKNGACVRLDKLVEENPDIIFLVKQSIECDFVQWWIERFDKAANQHETILLYTTSSIGAEINKKILEEYTEEFPSIVNKHLAGEPGFAEFRWYLFFNDFGKTATKLRRFTEYEEMVTPISLEDDFIDNDYSHLELEDD